MIKRECSVRGCNWKHKARGFCELHYARFTKYGSVSESNLKRTSDLRCKYHKPTLCLMPRCQEKVHAIGLCQQHCSIWYHYVGSVPKGKGNNHIEKERRSFLEGLYLKGLPIRLAARHAGIAHNTAQRHYLVFADKHGPVRCQCGQDSLHRGWCWWRFRQSSKRQRMMAAQGHWSGPITTGLYDKEVCWPTLGNQGGWQRTQ